MKKKRAFFCSVLDQNFSGRKKNFSGRKKKLSRRLFSRNQMEMGLKYQFLGFGIFGIWSSSVFFKIKTSPGEEKTSPGEEINSPGEKKNSPGEFSLFWGDLAFLGFGIFGI